MRKLSCLSSSVDAHILTILENDGSDIFFEALEIISSKMVPVNYYKIPFSHKLPWDKCAFIKSTIAPNAARKIDITLGTQQLYSVQIK